MIGVIEEPMYLDVGKPLQEQWLVKIGVVDPIRAAKEPFPQSDAKVVVRRLYRHIINELKGA